MRAARTALAFLVVSSPALAGSVAGRLLDPSGRPIAHAKVRWFPYRNDDQTLLDRTSGNDPSTLGEIDTDEQGRFRIVLDRPAASVSLQISSPGFASLRLLGPYGAAEDTALEDLPAATARPLTGTVVNEAGAPVPGARVTVSGVDAILDEDSLHAGEARTAANGAFSVVDAPDGPRTVAVAAAGLASFTRVQIEPRAEERIVLVRGGIIHGTAQSSKPRRRRRR